MKLQTVGLGIIQRETRIDELHRKHCIQSIGLRKSDGPTLTWVPAEVQVGSLHSNHQTELLDHALKVQTFLMSGLDSLFHIFQQLTFLNCDLSPSKRR